MVTYYHATPISNLHSIRTEGILRGIDGVVYCSTEEETCARWVSFKAPHVEKIVVLPFNREEGDERMSTFIDSHPMMLVIIGVDPATHNEASMASNEDISADDILWHKITTYDNPHFSEEAKKLYEEMAENNRKVLEDMKKQRHGICDDGIACEQNESTSLNERDKCCACQEVRDYEDDKFPLEE